MSNSFLSPWAIAALVGGYVAYRYTRSTNRSRKLPPGPKPLPILGNALDLPAAGVPEAQHWLKHKDLYGPISSVSAFGMTIVLIHEKRIAHDLLDQTSIKTSGRPKMVFAGELCGYDNILICQEYDSVFRHYRKLLHRELGTSVAAAKFQDAQEIEADRQLWRALDEPDKWLEHLKTTAGATILKMVYGYTVEPIKQDAFIALTDQMMTEFSRATSPMTWAVDVLPILRYLPENFPGATFKNTARKWRHTVESVAHIPYRFVERQMAAHTHRDSYVSRLIQQSKNDGTGDVGREDEQAIMWSAMSLYGAAADTTIITLTAFTAAMVMFPHVQKKAQEEIDRVIGSDRLPTCQDRERLPYVNAVVKEAMRWWPIAPMGFPHTATEDIEYDGLHIPKGAMILPAVWWFLHDPEIYADPDLFDPERFLSPRDEPDPATEGFGYGRRLCPGRFFAETSLYLNIAKSLATFNFIKAVGEDGEDIELDVKMKPGILAYVTDFQFKITPRSPAQVDLIRRSEAESGWDEGDAALLESVSSWRKD
ncbi:related to O-methylsterigmatocystin oxidoreductase [Cephalotrichum gorgonifer]|uniref:Related to O-methylsterigmatocystin oxidoreductase n=1 Tax=Cephalotrichum gorgonifer TaxID=2041049 RepID=A0AAE8N5T7_9PEZI|nr:related to O-methylsterigmatocystin oxidoreductase [Cephalotrichum gorgonifer]